jgi:hypothetical protein
LKAELESEQALSTGGGSGPVTGSQRDRPDGGAGDGERRGQEPTPEHGWGCKVGISGHRAGRINSLR